MLILCMNNMNNAFFAKCSNGDWKIISKDDSGTIIVEALVDNAFISGGVNRHEQAVNFFKKGACVTQTVTKTLEGHRVNFSWEESDLISQFRDS